MRKCIEDSFKVFADNSVQERGISKQAIKEVKTIKISGYNYAHWVVQQDEALWNHFMGIHELHTLLDGVDDSGMLPLHYAAKKNQWDRLGLLLLRTINNKRSQASQKSVLKKLVESIVMNQESLKCMIKLIQLLDMVNIEHKIFTSVASSMLFERVISNGKISLLEMLKQHGDPRMKGLIYAKHRCGMHIWSMAAAYGQTNVLDWLWGWGQKDKKMKAMLGLKNAYGFNIAHLAAVRGQTSVLNWLVQKGLEHLLHEKSAVKSVVGGLPLVKDTKLAHLVAAYGHINVLDWLWGYKDKTMKAMLSLKSKNGFNLAHFAAARGQTNVLNWLVQKGLEHLLHEKIAGKSIVDVAPSAKKAMVQSYLGNQTINAASSLMLFRQPNGSCSGSLGKRKRKGPSQPISSNTCAKRGKQ